MLMILQIISIVLSTYILQHYMSYKKMNAELEILLKSTLVMNKFVSVKFHYFLMSVRIDSSCVHVILERSLFSPKTNL